MALDRYEHMGWLKVYYRQIAKTDGFVNAAPADQWARLTAHVAKDNPAGDPLRVNLLNSIEARERSAILAWLRTMTIV